ncbi:MAG: ATP-binding protein, partial [Stellaceae bacterium]
MTGGSVQHELERAIEAASAERPLVLVLEDLHWSDPATITLLWALAARRAAAQLMILATYRSADAIARQHPIIRLKHELTAKRQCVDLALDGLSRDALATFLDRYFQKHDLPATFAACLSEHTTGNPLFVVNALADFARRGWLREVHGVWQCTVSLDTISAAIPESTRELIAFRLDQLPPTAQEILEAASIVGATFATQAVAAATERRGDEIEAEIEPMARAALFLTRDDDSEWPNGVRGCQYTFRHALYQQVLLRRITAARRQALHRRVAAALENAYGDRAAEIAGSLSTHYEQAGDVFRAVDYIDILVRQTSARSALHEAEGMLGHAVAL